MRGLTPIRPATSATIAKISSPPEKADIMSKGENTKSRPLLVVGHNWARVTAMYVFQRRKLGALFELISGVV